MDTFPPINLLFYQQILYVMGSTISLLRPTIHKVCMTAHKQ